MQLESKPTPSFERIRARDAERHTRRRLFRGLHELLPHFSPSERLILYILSITLAVSAFVLLATVNQSVSAEVPTQGGALVEGAVGTPRFINPLLAVSQADLDLTALMFSGLLRADPMNGYVPDLAESFDVSDDGTVYTFHLRRDLTFHDGTPLTSDDVAYTVALAQNPDIKSVRRADWEGVSVATPDPETVVFTLPHAYAPFRENATLGILPKELWESTPVEEFPFQSLNTHPVGSGPYYLDDAVFDTTGAPTEYTLRAFKKFALGEPNVTRIIYRTYANEDELVAAYEAGDIESFIASSPKRLAHDLQESPDLQKAPLARVFSIFLNQNHAAALADAAAREALVAATDQTALVDQILGGYGVPLSGPIPPGLLAETESTSTPPAKGTDAARDILTRGGWKFSTASSTDGEWVKGKTTLSITLATADTEELVATAEKVAEEWKAAGIHVTVQVYPLSEFNSTILRPRAYDAILFGEVVGRSLDLFAFWHSSQRNDPGLNLALYTSTVADRALAASRSETDATIRAGHLIEFLEAVDKDHPAVFLYSPTIAYILPSRLKGVTLGTLTTPADRFASVHSWYRDTERVWNIFSR